MIRIKGNSNEYNENNKKGVINTYSLPNIFKRNKLRNKSNILFLNMFQLHFILFEKEEKLKQEFEGEEKLKQEFKEK